MGKSKGLIVIDPARCKGCGLCIEACHKGYIVLQDQLDHRGYQVARLSVDHACNGCSFCAIACPDVAISVYRAKRSRG